jgi:hypothetical protein
MAEETKTRRSSAVTGQFTVDLSSKPKTLAALAARAKKNEHSISVEARRALVDAFATEEATEG